MDIASMLGRPWAPGVVFWQNAVYRVTVGTDAGDGKPIHVYRDTYPPPAAA